ncbi:hypothetical protein [Micromonospora sp. WMMD980]|uniref:hypothetical protein n=1 Tax=Micromonospora sp. WMMD980 TaxID=3016088 RepID=UPI0024165F27|nr:hypothetical protein [Micromonospora sp. WMMD980]MDG4802283.1 hypothetical protein [Micromonospora sp. WMMD980]
MNTILRKSVLGVAGLAFTGGVFAGPIAGHADTPAHAASKPVTATASVQGAPHRTGSANFPPGT